MRLNTEPQTGPTLTSIATGTRAEPRVASGTARQTRGKRHALAGLLVLAALALAGCGTQPARDFRGSWKPVNRFQARPTEIPLERQYTFFAAPLDETLRTMLERWAKDTGRTLDYELGYDVTLYRPVADIHTTDLAQATEQLSTIYAAQSVQVVGQPRRILVRTAVGSAASTPATAARP